MEVVTVADEGVGQGVHEVDGNGGQPTLSQEKHELGDESEGSPILRTTGDRIENDVDRKDHARQGLIDDQNTGMLSPGHDHDVGGDD